MFCKPDVLKPDVLKPDVLKPDVLKPDFLKPDVLWVYRLRYMSCRGKGMACQTVLMEFSLVNQDPEDPTDLAMR
jgi:hypothetical protein